MMYPDTQILPQVGDQYSVIFQMQVHALHCPHR